MMRRATVYLSLAAAMMLGACASPKPPADYVVLLPDAKGAVGKVIVKGALGQQVLSESNSGTLLDGSRPPAPVAPDALLRDFGDAFSARPELPVHFVLYFETGGAILTPQSQALIPTILETTRQRSTPDVSVVGHSDTVGRADANARLAQQRAQSIANLLRSQGLQSNSLRVESHGEANPLVPTPDETPEPRNRRVEVTIR